MGLEEQWNAKRRTFQTYYALFEAHAKIDPSWTIAEFGVGAWGFARFYAEKCKNVIGIDVEDYSTYHPGINFIMADNYSISAPDDSFDMIVSHSVLNRVDSILLSLSEINRITKPGGIFYLTVNPLYYSGYGAHLYEAGKRLDSWEHLDPRSRYFDTENMFTGGTKIGRNLNKMTSSQFLMAVGRQPWEILSYQLAYEKKPIPYYIDETRYSKIDLITKEFRLIARKNADYYVS